MEWALVIAVIAVVIALGSLCAAIFMLYRAATDPDVDELAAQVLSLRKSHRAEQMRRVRETPPAPTPGAGEDHPAGLVPGTDPMARMSKDDLRKIALGVDVLGRRPH